MALTPADFNGAPTIEWFKPGVNQIGDPADRTANAYANAPSSVAATVIAAGSAQALTVSLCDPAGLCCNVQDGIGLLLATNVTGAPIRIDFSQGVKSVGAFVVAQANFGVPFVALAWVWLDGAARWEPVFTAGMTADIVRQSGDPIAPFVGARAPAGDRISKVYFDAAHPSNQLFSPIGIGLLYFWA